MRFEANNIVKSFGEKLVLDNISIRAQSGCALGLLGRNGAGKTTTLRIIMGVFPPDSGEILIDGNKRSASRFRIGYLPEERGLYPKKPIAPQLMYLAQLRGMRAAEAKKSMEYWLQRTDMQQYANKRLDTLSKGNQQKIQLAATLITNPDIVILDEPFSGLDPVNAQMLKEIVMQLVDDGKCVIFSSHQMGYIDDLCKDIAIINKGKIAISGELDKIRRGFARDRIILKFSDRDAPRAKDTIMQKFGGMISAATQTPRGMDLTLASPDSRTQLFQQIGQTGLDVETFAVHEPTLNDIFIKYAGEEATAQ